MQVATIAWFEADSICGSHSVAIPLVLVLPYIFRLMQCLRQYKDTKEKTTLFNGTFSTLKYVIIPPVWFACLSDFVFFIQLSSHLVLHLMLDYDSCFFSFFLSFVLFFSPVSLYFGLDKGRNKPPNGNPGLTTEKKDLFDYRHT